MKKHTIFVAFASKDSILVELISTACRKASSKHREFSPWNALQVSGQQIHDIVHDHISNCDAFIADISVPNHNVTYEVGLAIGLGKPVKLIKSASYDLKTIEEIGLLHNTGHDTYSGADDLLTIFQKPINPAPWPHARKNKDQPIYLLESSELDSRMTELVSGLKKVVTYRFRNFSPREIDRLTASEAMEQISQSFGVSAIWHRDSHDHHFKQNQRISFSFGIAKGLNLPWLLVADLDQRLPLDIDEIATKVSLESHLRSELRRFKGEVAQGIKEHTETPLESDDLIGRLNCGDPAAENEMVRLQNYFLETEQFRQTLNGDLNIITGRKGSGKTAIFVQVRDRIRGDKENIVVDLAPQGFLLIRLRDFIVKQLESGARKEFISAFWEYIIWLEIAYKILEKDKKRSQNDHILLERYLKLESIYRKRSEGKGDFSERLKSLTDRILDRFSGAYHDSAQNTLSSSELLRVVYGSEITEIRDEVLSYLRLKGRVFFLFDNLDRFWTPVGFSDLDALLIIGLAECMQDIRKRFARATIDFGWVIFLRSDVYEFVVKGMADYGKLSVQSIEWNDREMLLKMFQNRFLRSLGVSDSKWGDVWNAVSVQHVASKSTVDYLLDASIGRPRYLIRLFETARRRATTLGKGRIDESDYAQAVEELGWQVLEDFGRELTDVVPEAEELLVQLAQIETEINLEELYSLIREFGLDQQLVDRVIDVLIWTGCIGVRIDATKSYISDCGFNRPFMRSLLRKKNARIFLHPTLSSIFESFHSGDGETSQRTLEL